MLIRDLIDTATSTTVAHQQLLPHRQMHVHENVTSYRAKGTDYNTYVTRQRDGTRNEDENGNRGAEQNGLQGYLVLSTSLVAGTNHSFALRSRMPYHSFRLLHAQFNLNCHRRFVRVIQSALRQRTLPKRLTLILRRHVTWNSKRFGTLSITLI